jgi:hypothetical protein
MRPQRTECARSKTDRVSTQQPLSSMLRLSSRGSPRCLPMPSRPQFPAEFLPRSPSVGAGSTPEYFSMANRIQLPAAQNGAELGHGPALTTVTLTSTSFQTRQAAGQNPISVIWEYQGCSAFHDKITALPASRDISPASSFNHVWQNLTNRSVHGFNFIQLSRFAALVLSLRLKNSHPLCAHRPRAWLFFNDQARNLLLALPVFGAPTRILP